MVLGVKHVVGHTGLLEQLGQQFTLFNGDRTHQHRLSFPVTFLHLTDDGTELAHLGFIHRVGTVLADYRTVGGDFHHVQIVNGFKFFFLRQCCTGHTGKLIIKTEEILEGNGGKGFALAGNLHPFLGFDSLMQAFVVPSAVHQTAGKFVNNDDFPIFYHVVDVFFHQTAGLHRLIQMVVEGGIFRVG